MESHLTSSVLTHVVSAATTGKSGLGSIAPLLMLGALAGVFYMIAIRPQRKKQQAARAKAAEATVGDKVLLAGGFVADIIAVRDTEFDVRLSANSTATVYKAAVIQVLTPPAQPLDDVIGDNQDGNTSDGSTEAGS